MPGGSRASSSVLHKSAQFCLIERRVITFKLSAYDYKLLTSGNFFKYTCLQFSICKHFPIQFEHWIRYWIYYLLNRSTYNVRFIRFIHNYKMYLSLKNHDFGHCHDWRCSNYFHQIHSSNLDLNLHKELEKKDKRRKENHFIVYRFTYRYKKKTL